MNYYINWSIGFLSSQKEEDNNNSLVIIGFVNDYIIHIFQ